MDVFAESFIKSLSNYSGRLRIIQRVMLTSAPYSCFIRTDPVEKDSKEKADEEGDDMWVLFGFLCLEVKPREALTEMWHIAAMSKTSRLSHSLICQVRQCFGSVGGSVCCVCSSSCAHVIWSECALCIDIQFVSVSVSWLSVSSCQFSLSFKHQWRETFSFFLLCLKIVMLFLKQRKRTERETENCRKSRAELYHMSDRKRCVWEQRYRHVNKVDFYGFFGWMMGVFEWKQ